MKGIMRYKPVGCGLARLDPLLDIDEMINKFMVHPLTLLGDEAENEPQIRMDVRESDGKYLVNAEIPGANKDDIHVSVEGKRVIISAEVKHEKSIKEGLRAIRSERSYGMAQHSFTLACEVDQDKIQAQYKNGVLQLTLPKSSEALHKEISIS